MTGHKWKFKRGNDAVIDQWKCEKCDEILYVSRVTDLINNPKGVQLPQTPCFATDTPVHKPQLPKGFVEEPQLKAERVYINQLIDWAKWAEKELNAVCDWAVRQQQLKKKDDDK